MNKAVCILGIVVMVAKGTLTPSVSVRCRNPQPDFKETVSVNGTTICHSDGTAIHSRLKIVRPYGIVGWTPTYGTKGSVAFRLLSTTPQTVKRSGSDD